MVNRMIKKCWQVIMRQMFFCLFLCCAFPIFANVGVFRGNGQTPILSSTAQIQMVEEEIIIYPVRGNYPTDDSCAYPDQMRFVCRFLLRNLTDQKVTVPVGFPIDFQVFRADEKRIKEANQVHHVAAFGFVAGTKEQTFPVRFCFEDKDKKFRNLFLWDMTFQPGEEIELHISYQTGGYYGLASTTIDPTGVNTVQMPEKFSFLRYANIIFYTGGKYGKNLYW